MQSYSLGGNRKRKRGWIFLAVIAVLLIAAVVLYTQGFFRSVVRRVGAVRLRCVSTQDIQPFGADVLYYDGDSLFCITSAGVERWNYRIGSGASYHAADGVIVIWRGTQLSILNRTPFLTDNGISTFRDRCACKYPGSFPRLQDLPITSCRNPLGDGQRLCARCNIRIPERIAIHCGIVSGRHHDA